MGSQGFCYLLSAASKFDSPTVCLTIGGSERKYFLHKRLLIEKCPYFKTLFSSKLPTVEVSENAVQLDGNGCTEEALDALVDYIYHGSYESGVVGQSDAKCTTHATVYVLAERLCMKDLKQEALVNMARELQTSKFHSGRMSAEAATQLIRIVYSGTPDRVITPHTDPEEEAGESAIPDTNGASAYPPASERKILPDEPRPTCET
ncbi:MAG: hypothetical protein M1840_005121 [Geoglossum simile]|nr:MAG: hypothetical protein M1840_005121 [Geoglossum simile]